MRGNRILLSIMGVIWLCTGMVLLAFSKHAAISSAYAGAEPAIQVYIGKDSCFTCHEEFQAHWNEPLHPRQIESFVPGPYVLSPALNVHPLPLAIGLVVESLRLRGGAFDSVFLSEYSLGSLTSIPFIRSGDREEHQP